MKGDICDENLYLKKKFHFIYCSDVLEHVLMPWKIAKNIL
jgi:2-polyprenyl-3-methyl-5-hydroxy-6-metoxy-1,4-benzoquinol methylase